MSMVQFVTLNEVYYLYGLRMYSVVLIGGGNDYFLRPDRLRTFYQ